MNIDGIDFGFVCTKNTPIYAYFNTDVGDNLTIELWKEIEDATVKNNPLYKNEYIVCTVNRVPNSYWKLSKRHDNVHIVKLDPPLQRIWKTTTKENTRDLCRRL